MFGTCAQGITYNSLFVCVQWCVSLCVCLCECVYVPSLPVALDLFTANWIWQSVFRNILKICNLQNCLEASVSGDTASFVKFSTTLAILFARDPPYIVHMELHILGWLCCWYADSANLRPFSMDVNIYCVCVLVCKAPCYMYMMVNGS